MPAFFTPCSRRKPTHPEWGILNRKRYDKQSTSSCLGEWLERFFSSWVATDYRRPGDNHRLRLVDRWVEDYRQSHHLIFSFMIWKRFPNNQMVLGLGLQTAQLGATL